MHSRFDLNALDPLVAPRLEDRRPQKPALKRRPARGPELTEGVRQLTSGKLCTDLPLPADSAHNTAMMNRDLGVTEAYKRDVQPLGVGLECALADKNSLFMRVQTPVERIVPLDELVRTTAQETAAKEVKKLIDDLQAQQQRICGLEIQLQAQRRAWRTHLPRQPRGIGMSNISHYDYMPPEELQATFGNIEVQMANGCRYCALAGSVNWGYDPVGGQHVVSWRYLT